MTRHDAYHEHPALSSHKLADYRRNGAWYFYRRHIMGTVAERDVPAFGFGRGFHAQTLEGDEAFAADFIEAPPEHLAKTGSGNLSTSAATKAWLAEQERSVLSPNDVALIRRMADAVRSNPVVAGLLKRGKPEVEKFAKHASGLEIKGRADWHAVDYGLDLKSCASMDEFEADAARFNYVDQGAFYCRLFGWRDFYLVACCKETCAVAVYRVDPAKLEAAADANDAAMHEIAHRREHDDWRDGALIAVTAA